MSDDPNPLSLVPTPDLVVELAKRFENLVLLSQKDVNVMGDSEAVSYTSGNHYACMGIIAAKYHEMILEANDE